MFRFSLFQNIVFIIGMMIVALGIMVYAIVHKHPAPIVETKINCNESVSKQVDPDNLNIIYTVPTGCVITVVPMIWTVPPPYWELLLQDYIQRHQGIPPTILLPKEWYDVILPSEREFRGSN